MTWLEDNAVIINRSKRGTGAACLLLVIVILLLIIGKTEAADPMMESMIMGRVLTNRPPTGYTKDGVPIWGDGTEEIAILWTSVELLQSGSIVKIVWLKDGMEYGQWNTRWPEDGTLVINAAEMGQEYNVRGLHCIEIWAHGALLDKVLYMITPGE